MSLFIRLSTVAVIAVLLRCVPATVVITAPSKVTDNTAGLETREQGPTAWICSVLAVDSPWNAYANIRGYLEGGNAEKKNFSDLVLYPVMELFHASQSRLCVYLPAEDHCFPPTPTTSQVKAVKQLSKQNYYAIRFWGQASDARRQYYKQKLTAAINTQSKSANFDLFFVSYFSDHVREVRYDSASTSQGRSADSAATSQGRSADSASSSQGRSTEPPTEKPLKRPNTCPSLPDASIASLTTKVAGLDYVQTTLSKSRLSLSDVQILDVNDPNLQNKDACARKADSQGNSAFSFVSGACKLYNFQDNFCPCARGDFNISINPKLWGRTIDLPREKLAADVEKKVIYTDIPLVNGPLLAEIAFSLTNIKDLASALQTSSSHSGAFFVNNTCYLTRLIDFDNCNQTCMGEPVDVLVKTSAPLPKPPILSLCGQKIVVPRIDNGRFVHTYFSHNGFGCYHYRGVVTAGGEDCIVTFEKDSKTVTLHMNVVGISLDSEGTTCRDELSIYTGNTTADASRKFNGCSWSYLASAIGSNGAITVKFRRGIGSAKSAGFKLEIRTYNF